MLKSKEGRGQCGEGGREGEKEDSGNNQVRTGGGRIVKTENKAPCLCSRGSVMCHPGSWGPLSGSRAAFSLAVTRQAFPLVGGGRVGLGRALPFLISF